MFSVSSDNPSHAWNLGVQPNFVTVNITDNN